MCWRKIEDGRGGRRGKEKDSKVRDIRTSFVVGGGAWKHFRTLSAALAPKMDVRNARGGRGSQVSRV